MKSLVINEVRLKENPNPISIEVYYIGVEFYLMYKDYKFTLIKDSFEFNDKKFKTIFPFDVPFEIIEIRENEDLDNTFLKTRQGNIIRTNIEDSFDGHILQTISYIENKKSNDYYDLIKEWFEESLILNI